VPCGKRKEQPTPNQGPLAHHSAFLAVGETKLEEAQDTVASGRGNTPGVRIGLGKGPSSHSRTLRQPVGRWRNNVVREVGTRGEGKQQRGGGQKNVTNSISGDSRGLWRVS